MSPDELRFRFWVDAKLVDETVIGTAEMISATANALADRHQQLAEAAHRAGSVWLIEIYDPAKPVLEAFTRFGTDTAGMIAPQRVDPDTLKDHL